MMTTSTVRIISVQVDPSCTPDPTRKRYLIRLSCGCSWWEDHLEEDAPVVGTSATCFALHAATAVA